MNKQLRGSILLFICAFIWGTAFVAQSEGLERVGVFCFSASRNFLAVLILIPFIFIMRKINKGKDFNFSNEANELLADKLLLVGGLLCGVALFVASNLQQFGIKYVTFIGKSGFLTALYIILVPIFGLFLHKKVGKLVWIGLGFALIGLYLLCIKQGQSFYFEFADIMLILCAAVFAIQILLVDKYAPMVDTIALACMQFLVCGTLSLICSVLFEVNSWEAIKSAALPIMYAGFLSSGVAYTLQMVGQKDMNPTVASLIMSLEAVVSIISGVILLHDKPSGREYFGCLLMFVGVILAQIPEKTKSE